MIRNTCALLALTIGLASLATPQETSSQGQVQIPLDVYRQLLEQSRTPDDAPVNYALGSAQASVAVRASGSSMGAEVTVTLPVEIFEDRWALVPVLPPGTAVSGATVQGSPVQLVATPGGLAWATKQMGAFTMALSYNVDASASSGGYVLAVPLPAAASIRLAASLPGTGLDVTVLPAAGVRVAEAGAETRLEATVPTSRGVQISWRAATLRAPAIGRADYRGVLEGDAIRWTGEFRVELFQDASTSVALLPSDVTLTSVRVDGEEASALVEGSHFTTLVRGRGTHRVLVSFETPVARPEGPPRVELRIPKVPVSRIELSLPGRKDLAAEPAASVATRAEGNRTLATVHVPLTERVSLSWSEAVPEVVRREMRANASLYHVLHAEEGVLFARARVAYEVSRGETNRIDLVVPGDVQVNQVVSESGAVADWRVSREDDHQLLQIFLDRQLQGELKLDVHYDRSLGEAGAEALPLLSARNVSRQRGMVALLSSRELALDPGEAEDATRVGENQLPSFVRDGIELVIAHTFKYQDLPPALTATATVPERVAGRFDAQVDSLLSLGEVTLTGAVSAEIHVKSGTLDRLELVLPPSTTLLSLTAPSLRTHRVVEGEPELVELEFTQEMDGHFRIELAYERILPESDAEVDARTVHVRGADVEQGRVAVEALSAAEVLPVATEELTPVEIGELPRQLVLQTTNPILIAYKYVRAEPEPRLAFSVTRHPVVDLQQATIDIAEYRTLFTRDGLSVTTARFTVRNARKQFLRVALPPDSDVWAVFVDGRPEKPALAEAEGESAQQALLIQIVNRTEGFPVEVVYSTRGSAIGRLGRVRAKLPEPDILVTESRWDLYLPEGLHYGSPSTNLDVVVEREPTSGDAMRAALELVESGGTPNVVGPLSIHVPETGIHYAFRKLYANQGEVEAYAAIPYASPLGAALGHLVSLGGAGVFWLGALSASASRLKKWGLAAAGAGLFLLATAVYGVGSTPSILLSLGVIAAIAFPRVRSLLERREPVDA